MASITRRTAKDGTPSYLVRIRLKLNGEPYTETKTFSGRHFKKRDAVAWAAKREEELLTKGRWAGEVVLAKVTLERLTWRYIEEFEELGKWGNTKRNDLRHLTRYPITGRPVGTLRSADYVQHIRERLAGGAAPATVNNDLIWWRIICRTARAAWHIPVDLDPIDDAAHMARLLGLIAKCGERDRRPSLEEFDKLMRQFLRSQSSIPLTHIIAFQIFSARRISETCRIRWDDYDPEGQHVLVRDMKDPRRKDNRVFVSLTREACDIIERQPRSDERIFPYNSKTIGSLFNRACKVVGIEDLRLHDLRHEGTSWLFEKGGLDIPQVSMITGHRSWAMLKRYTHLREKGPVDKYANWAWKAGKLRAVS